MEGVQVHMHKDVEGVDEVVGTKVEYLFRQLRGHFGVIVTKWLKFRGLLHICVLCQICFSLFDHFTANIDTM